MSLNYLPKDTCLYCGKINFDRGICEKLNMLLDPEQYYSGSSRPLYIHMKETASTNLILCFIMI